MRCNQFGEMSISCRLSASLHNFTLCVISEKKRKLMKKKFEIERKVLNYFVERNKSQIKILCLKNWCKGLKMKFNVCHSYDLCYLLFVFNIFDFKITFSILIFFHTYNNYYRLAARYIAWRLFKRKNNEKQDLMSFLPTF